MKSAKGKRGKTQKSRGNSADSEAHVEVVSVDTVVIAMRNSAVHGSTAPATSSSHPVGTTFWTMGIGLWSDRITIMDIPAPFPNITAHIMQPEGVR